MVNIIFAQVIILYFNPIIRKNCIMIKISQIQKYSNQMPVKFIRSNSSVILLYHSKPYDDG